MKLFVLSLFFFVLPATAQRLEVTHSARLRGDHAVSSGAVRDTTIRYVNPSVPAGSTAFLHFGLRLARVTSLPNPINPSQRPPGNSPCIMPLLRDWQRAQVVPMQSQETGFFSVVVPIEWVTKSDRPIPEQLQFAIALHLPNGDVVWEKPGPENALGFYYAPLTTLSVLKSDVYGQLEGGPGNLVQ